jgi:hypothetical protein
MSKKTLQFQQALMSTGLVQPLSEKSKGGHIEFLCRQVPGQERGWLQAVDGFLKCEEELADSPKPFTLHLCRRYLRREGQMVFGWHVGIDAKSAKDLELVLDTLTVEVLEGLKPSLVTSQTGPVGPPEPPVAVAVAHQEPLSPGRHPPPRPATPRAPNAPGTVIGTPPQDFSPTLRVVQNSRDDHGKVTIVEEMPLPHVYSDMNKPNAKGRGAKLTGGGS